MNPMEKKRMRLVKINLRREFARIPAGWESDGVEKRMP
jgi:hypothetical protein